MAEADGSVVAMAYLSSFYGGRPAYDATAEVSLYIATAYQRRGIGRRLKQWVIEQCPRLGVTTLLSMHFDHNEATRRINESLGFEQHGPPDRDRGGAGAEAGAGHLGPAHPADERLPVNCRRKGSTPKTNRAPIVR